ncbi:eukaryotic translation initiation factor 4 gamma 3-like [Adelges cooleyi]|uniref:eukaryotic translation initiation factor 4 gamma 3-like n=1 Tax=Adelges cooleyi TaxID=133065 RepID=UPI00217F843E|nr:eukaryotic translation initiation factor 4 gamma 3-like [Adelges cooleyi]
MVVHNRHKTNVLKSFETNNRDVDSLILQNLNISENESNIIKHSWQYTVQLNPITFYANDIDLQPNNEQQVWKETRYLFLYKKVLAILNKLTWVTFKELIAKFQELPIENIECLETIAKIVALKAFDEPTFGPLYAALCKALNITITFQDENDMVSEITFIKCIINVCQQYFQKECLADDINNNDISVEQDLIQRRLKLRAIGCLRFIGEIFKLSLLSPLVVLYCVNTLYAKTNENSLEYLCSLLKTAGKELYEKVNLNEILRHLTYLTSDDMRHKISPRIRFMIRDVIELTMNMNISDANLPLVYS